MKIGDTYEVKSKVTPDITAHALCSDAVPVFGTPYMVALMENAALYCMKDFMSKDKRSVGTKVNISHVSPSPIGMEVTVTVEVTGISENQKMVDFAMKAYDTRGLIGEGTHQRAVVDNERFMAKALAKLEQ